MTTTINSDFIQNTLLYRHTDPTGMLPASPFSNLTFPLNVYAHAIFLQEGKTRYLHYGLFQNDQTNLPAAQQYSTDLLTARLPSPPCRILEVGSGLGTTLSLLSDRGYDIQGITPDAEQIAYIQKTQGAEIAIHCQSFEHFQAQRESFDIILFQESAQYIAPLAIFKKAFDLLTSTGNLFVIDEFALKHDETSTPGLHHLQHFIALADRLGFTLIEHLDLSTLAAPTLAYLLQITQTHRTRLLKDLPVSNAQLDQLDDSNRRYQQKYATGHYGYALLHFRKAAAPKWQLVMLTDEQIPGMLNLFKKTFQQEMSPAFWQWKYPASSGREIAIWQNDRLLGHYGGIGRRILFFDTPHMAVQIGDVMVDVEARGTLSRKGPFFLMASTFLEHFIGFGKQYLIGFGFPNDRAMKVAERLGLYAEVGRMVEISWPPRTKIPLWRTRLQMLDCEHPDTVAIVDDCWQRMSADFRNAIIGIRDWMYFQHRYLNHPQQSYQIVSVKNRFNAKVHGILVLRCDHDDCEIVDIIAPLAEIPLLTIHARRLAGMRGAKRVFCQVTENFAAHFAATGENRTTPTDIRIPTNIWSSGPSPEILKNHWWLMGGDKDFR